jgi:peptidoglycan/LPS O-acetylase OafA/YrhL
MVRQFFRFFILTFFILWWQNKDTNIPDLLFGFFETFVCKFGVGFNENFAQLWSSLKYKISTKLKIGFAITLYAWDNVCACVFNSPNYCVDLLPFPFFMFRVSDVQFDLIVENNEWKEEKFAILQIILFFTVNQIISILTFKPDNCNNCP